MSIHPTAVVHTSVELDPDVEIGPYAVVGPHVRIGRGTKLAAHVVLEGPTVLGEHNAVFPFAVIGGAAQDKRAPAPPSPSVLRIGHHNVFREHVTVHRGTGGRGTSIADHNLFMVGVHVAHDVEIGSHVTLANGVLLAGHVAVADHVTFGGGAALAQHVCVGESAFVAGGAMVERNVPPFVIAAGDRARVRGLNKVGLRRRGFDEETITRLERALRSLLFGEAPISARAAALAASEDVFVAAMARAWTKPT